MIELYEFLFPTAGSVIGADPLTALAILSAAGSLTGGIHQATKKAPKVKKPGKSDAELRREALQQRIAARKRQGSGTTMLTGGLGLGGAGALGGSPLLGG